MAPITISQAAAAAQNEALSSPVLQLIVRSGVAEAEDKKREFEQGVEKSSSNKQRLMPASGVAPKISGQGNYSALIDQTLIQEILKDVTSEERANFLQKVQSFEGSFHHLKMLVAEKAPTSELLSGIKAVDKSSVDVLNAVPSKSGDQEFNQNIWYLLAKFMANDIMEINEKEESSAMLQVQVDADQLANVSNQLGKINPDLKSDYSMNYGKLGAYWGLGGIAALLLAPFTAGASIAAYLAIGIAATVQSSQPKATSFNWMADNTPDTASLTEASNTQVLWSNIGTTANQLQQTVMQLHVSQPSQVINQAGQQFSQMIQYAAQTANTSTR